MKRKIKENIETILELARLAVRNEQILIEMDLSDEEAEKLKNILDSEMYNHEEEG